MSRGDALRDDHRAVLDLANHAGTQCRDAVVRAMELVEDDDLRWSIALHACGVTLACLSGSLARMAKARGEPLSEPDARATALRLVSEALDGTMVKKARALASQENGDA